MDLSLSQLSSNAVSECNSDTGDEDEILSSRTSISTSFCEDAPFSDRSHGMDGINDKQLAACLNAIPEEDTFPAIRKGFKVFKGDSSNPDHFAKRPQNHEDPTKYMAKGFLKEIVNYEKFETSPHPHIIEYHGCLVKEGRIEAIVLPRLVKTLEQRIAESDTVNAIDKEVRKRWITGIEAGVAHLHSLGLAHNDLNYCNVMLDSEGNAVLIDFETCAPFGELLHKRPPYAKNNLTRSDKKHDACVVREMRKKLGLLNEWDLEQHGEYSVDEFMRKISFLRARD